MTHPSQGDVAAQQDSMTDEELLASVRAGDTGAYAALYRRHLGAALAQARRLVGSHDGQDVAQEAFLKVLRAITGGGGPHDSFAAYLMRVVHNEAVDRLRRTREASVDDVESVEATSLSASATVTGGEQLDRDLVLTAFSALPQQWQRILWLTEVDGLAPREVAPQLRRSPNAVAQLSRRAREGLRTAWLQAHVDGATVRPECRQIAADLGGYERGQLSAARAERTTAHLADCVRCSVALRDLRALSMRMRGVLLPLVLGSPLLLEELAEVLPLADQGAAPGAVPKSASTAEAASSAETVGAGEVGGATHRPTWWRAAAAGAGVPVAAAGVAVLVGAAGLVLVAQHPGSDLIALTPAQGLASPHSVEPEPLEADAPAATPPPTLLPAVEEADDADDATPEVGEPAPGTGDAADASPVSAAPPVGGADPSRAEPVAASDSSPTEDAPPSVEAPPAADALPAVEVPPSTEIPPTADIPPSGEIPPTQDLVLAPGGGQDPGNGSPSEVVGEPSGKPGAPEVPDPPLLGGTPPGPPTPPPPPDPPLLGGGAPPWLPVDPTPTPEDPEVPPEDPEPPPEAPEVPPEAPELPPEAPEVPPEAPEPGAPDVAPEAPDAPPEAPAPPVEEPTGE